MVKVTRDEKAFFEKYEGPLFIYGCTMLGKYTGMLLDRCQMKFVAYIDKNTRVSGKTFFGHSIINRFQLSEYIDSPVYNIILTIQDTKSVLLDFWNMDKTKVYNFLLPKQYGNGSFNGNLMLAPLRYRLLNNKKVSIIANNCSDSSIYRYLGIPSSDWPFFSFDGAAMWPTDFLKFVEAYEYYMKQDLQIDVWEYRGIIARDLTVYPSGKLGDIRIHFTHPQGGGGKNVF